jgi:hypothetical protein
MPLGGNSLSSASETSPGSPRSGLIGGEVALDTSVLESCDATISKKKRLAASICTFEFN